MCGIVGCVSKNNNLNFIVTGLKRLEYRGYDSSGVCALTEKGFVTSKAVGKIKELEKKLYKDIPNSTVTIGHTRWATHGKVNEINAHPHIVNSIALVHNGIIENFSELKKEFQNIVSETDTEIIAHLIDKYYYETNNFLTAISKTVSRLSGMFSLAILNKKEADTLYVVKKGTPLLLGKNKEAVFVASDIHPLVDFATVYTILEDGELAKISSDEIQVMDFNLNTIDKKFEPLNINIGEISKSGYKHYMQKEIFEQPQVLIETIKNNISENREEILFDDTPIKSVLNKISNIKIVACGTAWHAALLGKYFLEKIAKISTEIDLASEFRYRDPCIDATTLVVLISQSGETADTLAALSIAKKNKAYTLAICNRQGSTLHREADYTLFTQAGIEIGVAATKSFTAQISILLLLSIYAAKCLDRVNQDYIKNILADFIKLPTIMENVLGSSKKIKQAVDAFSKSKTFLFIGRGIQYPLALEGALKLKEITYVHAEGYASGELKHGPIALVDEDVSIIALSLMDDLYEKMYSNLEEIRARGGKIFAICSEQDEKLQKISDLVLRLPKLRWEFIPIVESIPIQLFSYHFAVQKGTDLDKPRNLAKSVTVE